MHHLIDNGFSGRAIIAFWIRLCPILSNQLHFRTIQLPNELLSYIILEALRSPRLSVTTDELFIQPKCKLAFESLSKGFGGSCRKFRAILLREWFRVFHVYELVDIERLLGSTSGGITSVTISSFVRELYFHQTMELLPRHFDPLHNLHTISYPLRETNPITFLSTDIGTDPGLPKFPASIRGLELRDALNCSPEELRSTGVSKLAAITSLKISCGESGAWAAVPGYGTGDAEAAVKRLAKAYIDVLSPLSKLRTISFDVHLSDIDVFHNEPSPTPTIAALPALNVTPMLPQPTVPEVPCTGNNLCSACWEARRTSSQHREVFLAKMLGRNLRWLRSVEWTMWHREEGRGEEKKRVILNRDTWGCSQPSVASVCEHLLGLDQHSKDTMTQKYKDDDIVCTTTRVPLAMYPAVLG